MQRNKKTCFIPKRDKKKTKQVTETAFESDQNSDLTEKDFKVAIINIFTKLKEV